MAAGKGVTEREAMLARLAKRWNATVPINTIQVA
jgi:hypothetical protein